MDLIPIWKKREFYKGTKSKSSLLHKLPFEIVNYIINLKVKSQLEITLNYIINDIFTQKIIYILPNAILSDLFQKIKDTTNILWDEIYLGDKYCNCNIFPSMQHQHLLGTLNLHENTYYCGDINKKIYEVGIYPNCTIKLI